MQELILNLPFDKAIFHQHQKLRWQIFVKKKYSKYLIFYGTTTVILLIVFINLLMGNGQPYSPAYFSVTLFLLIYNLLSPWVSIYKTRKRFFDAANKVASDPQKENFNSTLHLNDEGIMYEDFERVYKMKWSLFQPIYIYKDNIVLSTKEQDTIFLMLGASEVDQLVFNSIRELLERHVGLKKASF